MRHHFRRIAGFALVPGLSLVASLLILPAISSRFGADGWSSVALGQSIGAIVGVFAGLHWPIIGGHAIATASAEQRFRIYADSLTSRLLAFLAALPLAIAVALVVSGPLFFDASLFVVATALNALTASWYFAGTGDSRSLIVNEALVRLGGYGVALVLLLLGAPLASYGIVLILVGVAMPLLTGRVIFRGARSARFHWSARGAARSAIRGFKQGVGGGFSRTASQAFYYSGPSLVALLAPNALPLFAALDQLQKAAVNGLNSLPQAFVGWVSGDSKKTSSRTRLALLVSMVSAVVLAILIGITVPLALNVLFAGKVHVDVLTAYIVGGVIAGGVSSQALSSLVLVPLGLAARIYPTLITAAILSAIALVILVQAAGATGAMLAVLIFVLLQDGAFLVSALWAARAR